jgi:hypothetical protein
MHPQPRVRLSSGVCTRVFTAEAPDTSGIPHAMVLTVSFALSPVIGLSCHRHPRDAQHHRELDASVEASGPHDFAVRISAVRYRHLRVHRIPPRVRDDREPPLRWDETAENKPVIWVWCEGEIFLQRGLDRPVGKSGKSVGVVSERWSGPHERSDMRGGRQCVPGCRGACHRAGIRPTRWLAMTERPALKSRAPPSASQSRPRHNRASAKSRCCVRRCRALQSGSRGRSR